MANIKSAKKRISVIETKTAINRRIKSQIKTATKKFDAAIEDGNVEEAKALLRVIEARMDKAATKGTMHKNAVSRKVSRLSKRVNNAM